MEPVLSQPRYNAFISYSHGEDKELARQVQRSLARLAKPWYKWRALSVYRDETSMAANPALWTAIETALADSQFFILFASPGAAASPWVQREVAWWLANRPRERFLVVLASGEIVWDTAVQDYDWDRTTALPASLRGMFREPLFHIDLGWARSAKRLSLRDERFQQAVASLAAPLHGVSKDTLVGEEIRQQRRALRVAAIASVVILTLGSLSGKLYWDVRDQQQQAIALNKLNAIRGDLIRAIEWRRQPSRNAGVVRGSLINLTNRLSDHAGAHPAQIQAHYVKATAHFYLGELQAAEEALRRSLALDDGFSPGWTMLARVKFEQFKRTRYVSDYSQRTVRLAGGMKTEVSVRTITRETIKKEREHDPLLQEAIAALLRAGTGTQERLVVEKWGLERTPEDDVNDTLVLAMRQYYLDRDMHAAVATLNQAHADKPSEDYCLFLAWWSTDPASRLKWFEEAVFRAPLYAAAYLDRGDERHQRGDLDGAIADATKALEMDPTLVPAYVNRGNARHMRGDSAGAIADFSQVIELARSLPYPYYLRAVVREASKDRPGAIADLTQAISVQPDFLQAYYVRGTLRFEDGAFDPAIEDLTVAISGSAGMFPEALYVRARCRAAKGEIDDAIQDLSSAIAISPGYAAAQYIRADLRLKRGDARGAIEDLSAAVKNNPAFAEAYENRGFILYQMGDTGAALRDFDRSIAIAPSANAHNSRGLAYQTRGNLDAAISDYRKAVALKPDFAMAYYNLGNAWIDNGDAAKAIDAYTRTVKLDPKYAAAYHNRGQVHESLGDSSAAIADYTEAIRADPRYALGYSSRGRMLGMAGKLDGALRDFSTALELKPNDPALYFNRGLTSALAEDHRRAIADFDTAIKLDATDAKTYLNRAKSYAALREYEAAMIDCERAVQRAGGDEGIRRQAAGLLEWLTRRSRP